LRERSAGKGVSCRLCSTGTVNRKIISKYGWGHKRLKGVVCYGVEIALVFGTELADMQAMIEGFF